MQLTMEPLEEMLESAWVMDEAGMDTTWLRETKRLAIGWGIISPFTRHPVQVAMDARVVQEAAGPGRFLLGFGTSKIFLNNIRSSTNKTLGPMRDAVEIVRGVGRRPARADPPLRRESPPALSVTEFRAAAGAVAACADRLCWR